MGLLSLCHIQTYLESNSYYISHSGGKDTNLHGYMANNPAQSSTEIDLSEIKKKSQNPAVEFPPMQ